MLLSSLGTSVANVGLPTFAKTFGASFGQVQWVVLAYLLAVTSLIVGAGRLGDLVGRRRLLLAGIVLFTAASALCGSAPTLWLLVAARAAQGLGASVMMALTMAFVADIVPKGGTGRAMGLLGTMSAVGTALGPSLGGFLIAGPGWRWIFLVNLPLGAAAFLLARRHLPADRAPAGREPFDALGTILLAGTLCAYALAMAVEHGRFGPFNLALLAVASAGAGLFVVAERRAAAPLIRLAMLRDPGIAGALAASGLVATVMMATLVVGPFYLARTLGLSPALVGLLLSVGPAVAALTAVPAGGLTDRVGTRRTALAGLAAIAAGCSALALLPAGLGIFGYVAGMVVVTSGYAVFQTANNSAVMADVAPDRRGLVSGLLNLSRNLGLVTGASAMGAVFASASGARDPAAASAASVAAGMHATFAVAAAAILAGLFILASTAERPASALSA
ncbi:MAG: hypothetical protein QOJ91_2415 [Sphingomonadales bacterium]|nr:hypothetical protein [Sphingomonadales bacterium]